MVAHRPYVLIFARALREISKEGNLTDVEAARSAFAEIKHSIVKVNEVHQPHLSKMIDRIYAYCVLPRSGIKQRVLMPRAGFIPVAFCCGYGIKKMSELS